jgi:hypothetical protein
MTRAKAIATQTIATEVASDVLIQGGSALRAALSGFFAAAAVAPGVLFGPTTLFIGGVGVGARVFDGRCRQPGLEGKRPRGFQAEEEVPLAARAAVPGSIGAAAVATAYHPGASLNACVRPAIALCKKAGSKERAALLELVAAHGSRALLQPSVRQAWLTQLGPVEGGMVQPKDLEARSDLDTAAVETGGVVSPPWAAERDAEGLGTAQAVIAADANGLLVAMTFRNLPDRLRLNGFDVVVPLCARPVMRGVPRTAPGVALPAGADIKFSRVQPREQVLSVQVEAQVLQLRRDDQSREVSVHAPGFLL